jgi:hypothetical protein
VAGSLLKSMMVALLLTGAAAVTVPQTADAQSAGAKKAKPLQGKSYYGRRGGYTVRKSDVIGDTRRQDPTMNARTSGAPLQGDFFWEQPSSPVGGNTSYMH